MQTLQDAKSTEAYRFAEEALAEKGFSIEDWTIEGSDEGYVAWGTHPKYKDEVCFIGANGLHSKSTDAGQCKDIESLLYRIAKTITGKNKPRKNKDRQYTFQTVYRCPRCGVTDTRAQHTDYKKGIQRRICNRAICRQRFVRRGSRI